MPVVGRHVAHTVVVYLPQPPKDPRVYTIKPKDTFADIHSEKHPASSVLRPMLTHTLGSHSLSENKLRTCTPFIKIFCLLPINLLILFIYLFILFILYFYSYKSKHTFIQFQSRIMHTHIYLGASTLRQKLKSLVILGEGEKMVYTYNGGGYVRICIYKKHGE